MTSPETRDQGGSFKLRIFVAAFIFIVFLIVFVLAVTVIPREWAHWAGSRIDGQLSKGLGLGLTLGVVFTALPLVILRQTVRGVSWAMRWVLVVVAAVVALPNLLTLGIVLGSGNAAHAGERILDVEGPGFRAGSLSGAIVAALLILAFWGWRGIASRDK